MRFVLFPLLLFLMISCVGEFKNPLDPESEAYEPPSVMITSGPAENEQINSTEVTFTWSGNKPGLNEFRYRLYGYSDEWSSWGTSTSARFDYLDDASYRFEIETRYRGGNDIRSVSRNFRVDAVKGPTLKLYKLKNLVQQGSEFTVQVWIEDISKFKTGSFRVEFDKSKISLVSVRNGDFVSSSGLGQIIVPDFSLTDIINQANTKGSFEVTTGVLALNSAVLSLSGSGEIIKLSFKASSKGIGYIRLKDIDLRDESGNKINVLETPGAYVEVK